MTKIVPTKICELCKTLYSRHAPIETVFKFSKRRYCSPKCRATGNGYHRRGIPISEEKRSLLRAIGKSRVLTPEAKDAFVSKMARAREEKLKNNPERIYGGRKENRIRVRGHGSNATMYRLWRQAVLLLGNDKCFSCGSGKDLHVDHIKPYSLFIELRYAIDNGRVLCKYCHMKTNTFGFNIRKYK